MKIIMVELLNWASYKGRHVFNFYSDSGKNGYSIFGENSRGKTSFTDSIQWAMYGEAWTKGIINTKNTEIKKKRPLISEDETMDPLLNTHAFKQGDFRLVVKLTFTHEGNEWELARVAMDNVDNPRTDKDMGMSLYLLNKTTKDEIQNNKAQDFIDNLLPKDIKRFFFIDGESVNEYRALIANTEENLEIRKNIEDILNFPILKKGIIDLREVKQSYVDELSKLAKDTKKNRLLKEKIKKLDYNFNQIETEIRAAEEKKHTQNIVIEELEEKIKQNSSSGELIEKRRGGEKQRELYLNELSNSYNQRKRENKDLWLYILEPALKDIINEIKPKISHSKEVRHEISSLRNKISYLHGVIKEEDAPCSQCGAIPHQRDEEGRKKDIQNISNMEQEMNKLEIEIKSLDEIRELYSDLQNYNSRNRLDITLRIEEKLGEIKGSLSDLEKEKEEIDKLLDGIDEQEIVSLNSKLNEARTLYSLQKNRLDILENEKIEINSERSKHKRELIGSDGSEEGGVISNKIEMLQWLEDVWGDVLDNYAENTRLLVEKRASETFSMLTNNPEGYSGLGLNKGFGLRILDSDKRPIASPSPGAQQVAAVSLIDALGQTSDIEFPILFDTPGASIDQQHRNNIIEHFWSKRDVQLIILAHSGEFRPEEVEEKHHSLLARTWELKFDNKANTTKVIPRVI